MHYFFLLNLLHIQKIFVPLQYKQTHYIMDKIKDKMLTIALEEMNKRISDMGIYNPLNALVFKSGYKAGATNACENLLAMLVEKLGKDKVSEIFNC